MGRQRGVNSTCRTASLMLLCPVGGVTTARYRGKISHWIQLNNTCYIYHTLGLSRRRFWPSSRACSAHLYSYGEQTPQKRSVPKQEEKTKRKRVDTKKPSLQEARRPHATIISTLLHKLRPHPRLQTIELPPTKRRPQIPRPGRNRLHRRHHPIPTLPPQTPFPPSDPAVPSPPYPTTQPPPPSPSTP